ncbi:hypothetical protein [Desulfotomaculum copahuensis]|nr:hypothetical protein [Desulfotomaculum copahuensis]
MQIYFSSRSLFIKGRIREVCALLKEYGRRYRTLQDLINSRLN